MMQSRATQASFYAHANIFRRAQLARGEGGIEMNRKEYTLEDKDRIGKALAKAFHLKRDRDFPGRYQTTFGNKTPVGIFETFRRIGMDLENGNFEWL